MRANSIFSIYFTQVVFRFGFESLFYGYLRMEQEELQSILLQFYGHFPNDHMLSSVEIFF